jgi:hypothetical protein
MKSRKGSYPASTVENGWSEAGFFSFWLRQVKVFPLIKGG